MFVSVFDFRPGSLFLKMMTEVNGGESLPLLEHLFRASKDKRAQWSFDKPTASFSAKHRVAGERADFNHVLKRWDARRVIVTRERFTPDTHGDFVPVRLGLKATGRILDTEYKQWQTAWEMLVALLIEWTPEECPVCASSGTEVSLLVHHVYLMCMYAALRYFF